MTKISDDDVGIDSVLLTVENPVRRKIIRQLSKEPSYQLRISKELGFSQQLVAKHLDAMEDTGRRLVPDGGEPARSEEEGVSAQQEHFADHRLRPEPLQGEGRGVRVPSGDRPLAHRATSSGCSRR